MKRTVAMSQSHRRWGIGHVAGAALSLSALVNSASAQYVWTGPASGNFSAAANWQGGLVPPLSNPATTITFAQGNSAATTATNDLGSPLLANTLTFNVANAFTVNSTLPANLIQLVGPLPLITLSGNGGATLSATGAHLQLAANTTIAGSGLGGLTISGTISETGGPRSLTISGGAALPVWRMVTLGGTNTFSGGLFLDGGTVQTAGFGPGTFGAAGSLMTVTSNGGTIASSANLSNGVGLGSIHLNGTLRVIGSGASLLLGAASTAPSLNGSGPLVLNHSGLTGVTLMGDSAGYTGAVTIDRSTLANFTGNAGGFVLSGVGGSSTHRGALINVPSFDIRGGGTLSLSNGTANTLQNGNRIGDSATINIRSGNLTLSGPAAAGAAGFVPTNLTETIGAINGAGYSLITATPGTGSLITTTLHAASLSRVERGTFLFRGAGLGDGAVATRGNITFTTSPAGDLVGGSGLAGTTNISILPYAIGDTSGTGTGTSLVTYDANGMRPLASTEYVTDLVSGASTNARLTAATANAGSATVNALVVATGGSITGAGTLNVTSGTILNTSATGSIANTVNFEAVEAHVFSPAALAISGPLQGASGLTKSGGGVLTLTADNSGLTGPLTLNAGVVNFNAANALPGTGQIVVNGTGSGASANATGLTYSGASPLAMSRSIAVNGGLFNAVSSTVGSTLTLDGTISGPGGVFVSTTADVVLSGANTYTGPTMLGGGNLRISSDANLGAGGMLNLSTSATAGLILDGDWTTSRPINISGNTMINTQSFAATISGPFSGFSANSLTQSSAALTKLGNGVLNLAGNDNTFTGAINVNAGTLLVNGTVGASTTNAINVAAGAILGGSGVINRNVAIAGTLAPGSSAGILTVNGNATLSSGSFLAMELGGLSAGNGPGFADFLVVNGVVSLTDATLSAVLGFAAPNGSSIWLIANDGTDSIAGTFSGLSEGSVVSLGVVGSFAYSAQISYVGDTAGGLIGSGNDVVLYNIVPTPGSAGILALGGLVAMRRRRSNFEVR